MPRLNPNLFLDEDYEEYAGGRYRRDGRSRRPPRQVLEELAKQADHANSFSFSYHASRHESGWLIESLGGFYEGQWLRDVLRLVKGGKEASVYQCLAGVAAGQARYLAAKVYRPRPLRALKKDHLYREGRPDLDADGNQIFDHKLMHAIQARTSYGQELQHTSWIEHEYQALVALHAAGADVPIPYARGNNAILMGYIGGQDAPAPTLNSVELDVDEARLLFERLLVNVQIMLAQERVHGDLSAYNILYWKGQITLIDFPQVVNPHENRNAYRIFERDLARVCEYFTRQGLSMNPPRLAADLWTGFNYRLSPEVHPRLLDEQSEADRASWQG